MRLYLLLLLFLCNFFIITPLPYAMGGSQTNLFELTSSGSDDAVPAYKRRLQVTRMSGGSVVSFSPSSARSSDDLSVNLRHIILFVDRQGFTKTPRALYWMDASSYDDSEPFPQDNPLSADTGIINAPLHLTVLAPRGGKLSTTQKDIVQSRFPQITHLDDMAGVIRRSWSNAFSSFASIEKLSMIIPAQKVRRLGGLSQLKTLYLFIANPSLYRRHVTIDLGSLASMNKLEQLMISCTLPDALGIKPAPHSKRIRGLLGLDALPSTLQPTTEEECPYRTCLFDLSGTYIDISPLQGQYPHIHFINDVRRASNEEAV